MYARRLRRTVGAGRPSSSSSLILALIVASAGIGSKARAGALPPTIELQGDWSPEEREAAAALVARLPPPLLARAPRAVARDAAGCDSDGFPDDGALVDDAGRIHLCPAAGLPAPVVAHQVGIALLWGFDRAAGWSEAPAWRQLNGWRRSWTNGFRSRAENLNSAGFAAPRGQRSSRWDLVTFLSGLFFEGEAGRGLECRLMSQAVFVEEKLASLGGALRAAPRCPAFESWAELDRLVDVEVVLAAPSTAMVGSLFGHLMLRLVYRDDVGETPPHLSRTVAFLADNDAPFSEDAAYALKGIAGFYTASLHEREFLDTYREYVVNEGRDLQRWRLDFTPAERRRLLERIWTVGNGAHYPYYFFRRNCATLMAELVDGVRLPTGEAPDASGLLAAPPASILEPWARAHGADGAPFLQFVPEPILSFDHEARLASRHRRVLEVRLMDSLPPPEALELSEAFEDARSAGPERRAAAYRRLGRLLADRRLGAPADVLDWLHDSASVESQLSTLANLAAEARAEHERRQRVRAAAAEIAAALLAAELTGAREGSGDDSWRARFGRAVRGAEAGDAETRLDAYRALAELVRGPADPAVVARVRLLVLFESEARYDVGRMKAVPGLRDALLFVEPDKPIDEQPYLAGSAALIRAPLETRVSQPLRALQETKQALYEARDLRAASDDAPPAGSELPPSVTRAGYDASLPRTGIDQMAVLVGAGADSRAGLPLSGGLVLAGALYDERLGDHRRFGFPSETAFVVGRSSALLAALGGRPVVSGYDARLFGYRSLRLPLPEGGGGRWPVGWEIYVDLLGDRARLLAAETRVGWGLLLPLFDRGDLRDHLLGGLGLAYGGYFPASGAAAESGRPQALAAPFSLELRAGLGAAPRYRSWLAVRTSVEPMAVLAAAPRRLALEAAAIAEAHLALRSEAPSGGHDPALLARVQVVRTTLTFDGGPAITEAQASIGVELR